MTSSHMPKNSYDQNYNNLQCLCDIISQPNVSEPKISTLSYLARGCIPNYNLVYLDDKNKSLQFYPPKLHSSC